MKNKNSSVLHALQKFEEVVGEEYVVSKDSQISDLAKTCITVKRKPLAYLFPKNRQEVQSIVEIAIRFNIRLWAISTGRNWGYGTKTAGDDNTVVVVLQRMNRIIEVNVELAYAVIEPGVSYRQLNEYLKTNNTPLWADPTNGPPDGSVIGNALERGHGMTSYGYHYENLCGVEAVLPDGRAIETGGGSKSKTWNTYKWGTTPCIDGLFTQSCFGIVTKAGMQLMPKPAVCNSLALEINDHDDLLECVEEIRKLQLDEVFDTKLHIVNDFVTIAVFLDYPLTDRHCFTQEELATLRKKYGVAKWTIVAAIYGDSQKIDYQKNLLKSALGKFGKLWFFSEAMMSGLRAFLKVSDSLQQIPLFAKIPGLLTRLLTGKSIEVTKLLPLQHELHSGVPSDHYVRHAYFAKNKMKPADKVVNPPKDNVGLIWFAPIVPLNKKHVDIAIKEYGACFAKYGFDYYIALLLTDPRSIIPTYGIYYDQQDPVQRTDARKLYDELCRLTHDRGYIQYRSGNMCNMALDSNPNYKSMIHQLKHSFDPKGILSPGKYGIHPN